MKGIVVNQLVSDSVLDFVHGFKRPIKRIVFPTLCNLCITPDDTNIYVFRFKNEAEWRESCEVLFEIEVSEALISEAEKFLAAKERLDLLKPALQQLIGDQA